MELGKKIANLRKNNKVTQAQLAEYLAVQPQTISRWEADGGTPDVMLLPKIAMFFGVSMDELFGMTDMEQIENLVYKYSVLRDEKSFEEVMRSIDIAVDSIEEELQDCTGEEHEELKQKREQLLAWKVHIFIQKSRKAKEDAETQLDKLIEEVTAKDDQLYLPLKLQKQQFRIQSGEARKVVQEAKDNWESDKCLENLYCYMSALMEIENGMEILKLWEMDEVQALVKNISDKTEPLWETMFAGACMEQDLNFFQKYFTTFEKSADEYAVFNVEWELMKLYHELNMIKEKEAYKIKLLGKLEKLEFNEYIKSLYLKKIKEV